MDIGRSDWVFVMQGGKRLLPHQVELGRVRALMKEFLRLASQPSVVKRAFKCAIVVGCILITINHGNAILDGTVSATRLCQMALTAVVPYVVSTVSSVGAMREHRDRR